MNIIHDIIKAISYFKLLNDDDYLKLVDTLEIISLLSGEVLFHEGDFADAFYIVFEGAIIISTVDTSGNTIFLARITAGGFFGEQAFSQSHCPRRRASCTAQEKSLLYKFPRTALLNIYRANQNLQNFLSLSDVNYLKIKLTKLAQNLKASDDFNKILSSQNTFPQRSLIFYPGKAATKIFILLSGEVELRYYKADNYIERVVTISPGELFGIESQKHSEQYTCFAVAKLDTIVAAVDTAQYSQVINFLDWFKQLKAESTIQFKYPGEGNILQFRSEYNGRAATTSIITLKNKDEIICQHIIGANIFLAVFNNSKIQSQIKYAINNEDSRELQLSDNRIVGIIEYGFWDDRDTLLDIMINKTILTKEHLDNFSKSGYLQINMQQTVPQDSLVCKCIRVSYNSLVSLIRNGSLRTLAQVSKCCGAGTVCGACQPIIQEILGNNAWISCNINKIISHNSQVKSIQLSPITGNTVNYRAGQYMVIKVQINNLWIQRSYTLTSSSGKSYYEITIKREDRGMFSSWLWDNKDPEVILYLAGPYGNFTLDLSEDKPIVCFMGGIGVTPCIAFIRTLIAKNQYNHLYIDYSMQAENQIIFQSELEYITKNYKNIEIFYRVTSNHHRLSADEIQNIISKYPECHIYICGPHAFEKFVLSTVLSIPMAQDHIHVEEFIHTGAASNL